MKEERGWDVIRVAVCVVLLAALAWMFGVTCAAADGHLAEVTFWRTGCVITVIVAFCGRIVGWW